MLSYPNTFYLSFIFFMLGSVTVHGDPEPMARPTRPEIITSPEELRRYADLIKGYYSLSGKARYGKRGDVPSSTSDVSHAWETVKTMLDVSQESQLPKFEQRKQEKSRFHREFESSGRDAQGPRVVARPCHVLDIVEKYYDNVQ